MSATVTSATPVDLARVRSEANQQGIAVADSAWALLNQEQAVSKLLESAGVRLLSALTTAGSASVWVSPDRRAVQLTLADGSSVIAMEDPWDEGLVGSVALRVGRYVEPVAARRNELLALLAAAKPGDHEQTRVGRALGASAASAMARTESVTAVQFVDNALAEAHASNASDVHFETTRAGMAARLRLDGVMVSHAVLDSAVVAEEVINRIKVLAQLDITERRLPQDGRLRWKTKAGEFDIRVSIIPSIRGEDAVLRILDRAHWRGASAAINLASLGFVDTDLDAIRSMARVPHGMVLITGPTGSGKTTTVYAALSEVNNGLEKIVTIEDPVEYELPGVLQIPVNERKGLTFAKGLRAALRHDPDRILVGEIRDGETAQIAVQSALTGHHVFTTVHANSLLDVIGRFRHFEIDRFGFASALNGVVVQRLLRRLCANCRRTVQPTAQQSAWLERVGLRSQAWHAAGGCSECRNAGYKGRTVVAQVHKVGDRLRDLIVSGSEVSDIRQAVLAESGSTLLERATEMAIAGETSLEEIERVVGVD